MKIRRLFPVMPLLAASLWAAVPVRSELALPERVFPQLDGVLKSAVQQSPRMLSRALELEIAENNRIQARSNLLPSAGGSARYYQASDDRADLNGRVNVAKTYYDFSVTQPVFYWGERRNNARIGEIQATVAKGNYREAYRMLAQEVRASYLRLIVQKIVVRRGRFFLEYANTQLKQQEERLAKKVISETEIFSVRLNAEQAQIAVERNDFEFENAKLSFARLTGTGPLADDAIPDVIPGVGYSAGTIDGLLSGFLAQKDLPTTEAVSLRRQLEIDNLNYGIQKTRLRPKFNFVAGASQDEQSYTLNVAQKYRVNSLYVGLALNWAIFDGFASGAATRNALARRRLTENDYRILTERLGQQAQTQAKQINFSARNMTIYDRFLTSGEGNLNTVQDEFRRGVKSETDVSLARISLYDAQLNANNARIDYLLKVGDFLGTVMEDPVVANLAAK
jgi:outer membrane protein TolC